MKSERKWLRGAIPAKRTLDGPPATDEGKIIEVDMQNIEERRGETHKKECQECGDAVELTESHVKARLRVLKSTGPSYPRPVFCDRECWYEWCRYSGEHSVK